MLGVPGAGAAAARRGADERVLPPRAVGRQRAGLDAQRGRGRRRRLAEPGPVTEHVAVARRRHPLRRSGQGRRRSPPSGSRPSRWPSPTAIAVSDEVRACIQENVGRYTADYFMATEEARLRLRRDALSAARAFGPAGRHARVRAARHDLPRVREDSLPRDSRLLPQVHGRRAHAAHDPQSGIALASGERQPRAVRVHPERGPLAGAADAGAALPRRRQVARRRPRRSRACGWPSRCWRACSCPKRTGTPSSS